MEQYNFFDKMLDNRNENINPAPSKQISTNPYGKKYITQAILFTKGGDLRLF